MLVICRFCGLYYVLSFSFLIAFSCNSFDYFSCCFFSSFVSPSVTYHFLSFVAFFFFFFLSVYVANVWLGFLVPRSPRRSKR